MINHSLTKPQPIAEAQPCLCGCAPCADECHALECLDRPRFFCGQLLTDADLQAAVDWATAKFRLKRYLHGWGAVCGLDVRSDPHNPARVIVSPGYALDCCGRDIVVCEEVPVDLSEACQEEGCVDPSPSDEIKRIKGVEAKSVMSKGKLLQPVTYDLYIHYREKLTHPSAVLAGGSCGHSDQCEYSRVREGYWVRPVLIDSRVEYKSPAYERWLKEYSRQTSRATELAKDLIEKDSSPDLVGTVRSYLRANPLQKFPFILDELDARESQINDTGSKDEPYFKTQLAFWLWMDARLQAIQCPCDSCESDEGVPLARVWVSLPERESNKPCRVSAVLDYAPFRRDLRQDDCWLADPGCINLAQYIWKPKSVVMRDLGMDERDVIEFDVEDRETLRQVVDSGENLQHCRDEPLGMYVVTGLPPGDGLVVGFTGSQVTNGGIADKRP